MFDHDYYSKPLSPEQRAGLPAEVSHAVYSRNEAGARLVALCVSERAAEHVEMALKLYEAYAHGDRQRG